MKENGVKTLEKDSASKGFRRVTFLKVSGFRIKCTAKESYFMQMERLMKVSGTMVRSWKDMVFLNTQMAM